MVQISDHGAILRELPVTIPEGCAVDQVSAPPVGETVAIEFSCSFGQAVVWFDTRDGKMTQPITDSDSHFMAWAPDGQSAYLKVATMSRPHIVRAPLSGKPNNVPITEFAYDLSPKPGTEDQFLFSFSRGMGLGSEMWLAQSNGRSAKPILSDRHNYLSFARWSPDSKQIAFIRIPDVATPFTVGELWVMDADGSNSRKLADADAGHGYAEAWSPGGNTRLAFVVRENPNDENANQNADALESNIGIFVMASGVQGHLTNLIHARVEAPVWSPDGASLAFTVVLNDKMGVYLMIMKWRDGLPVLAVPSCCPVWTRK